MSPAPAPKKDSVLKPAVTYLYRNGLYVNLTGRCPTQCAFCVKYSWDWKYRGYDLRLSREPALDEVLSAVRNEAGFKELVFCGYGESTYRLEDMREISETLKADWKARQRKNFPKIRLNTIGLGNLIHGRDIAGDLAGFLDCVSVSLNTSDPIQWLKLHRPLSPYRKKGFESVLDFIRNCVKALPETIVTAVELPGVDLQKVKILAESLGARFRLRPFLRQAEAGAAGLKH